MNRSFQATTSIGARVAATFALLVGSAGTLAAQSRAAASTEADPPRHSGFQLSAGFGGGKADFTCEDCVFDSEAGYSAFLAVSRAVAPATAVGVELSGWTRTRSGFTDRIYSITANVTQYLSPHSGLFMTAGLGVAGFDENGTGPARSLSGAGFGVATRLGYEVGFGRVAVVPYVGYVRGLGTGDLSSNGNPVAADLGIHEFQFGLGFTWP